MKRFTVDANVIIKWIFPENPHEDHAPQAIDLLKTIKQGIVNIIQPPHWLAETIAVITRLEPAIAEDTITLLNAMDFPVAETTEIYKTASKLAQRYQHHLFDTLYHAVALNHNAQLVTADEKYYRKAFKEGSIIRLADFSIFEVYSHKE